MRILGIDPGLANVGFAILEVKNQQKKLIEFGVIKTDAKLSTQERLEEIYNDISDIIGEYKPNFAAVEQIFFSNNVSSGIDVAKATGAILIALKKAGIETHEYSPSQMKLALTGDGKADKQAIQKMVMLELSLTEIPKPDHAADAASLALTLSFELR